MNTLLLEANTFSFSEGTSVSVFSMLIVFLILLLLSFIIYFLRYLPSAENKQKNAAVKASEPQASRAVSASDDQEERMVAMLVASCIAKDEIEQDVQIISIERTK